MLGKNLDTERFGVWSFTVLMWQFVSTFYDESGQAAAKIKKKVISCMSKMFSETYFSELFNFNRESL